MKLDAKLKGGLAWAGLVVILAVPSADILFGKSDGKASANTATVADVGEVKTTPAAKIDPIETASVGTKDPVNVYVNKGKKLPSYISDGNDVAAETPAVLKPAPVAEPTEVASIAPASETPPVPLPRGARPKWTNVASTPAAVSTPAEDAPLIIDENQVAAVNPVEPFPLSDDGTANGSAPDVTSDQLEEWDSGSLADYLAKKGLLSDNSQPQAQQPNDFDADGFFLDEGPNAKRRVQQDDSLFLF